MSEEAKEQEQATEEAETATEEATDLQAEVQKWKAHAREQEKRAKANKAAAVERVCWLGLEPLNFEQSLITSQIDTAPKLKVRS